MSQFLPTLATSSTAKYIDHMQRRYRWVGPRGRRWYYVALRAIVTRHSLSLLY